MAHSRILCMRTQTRTPEHRHASSRAQYSLLVYSPSAREKRANVKLPVSCTVTNFVASEQAMTAVCMIIFYYSLRKNEGQL